MYRDFEEYKVIPDDNQFYKAVLVLFKEYRVLDFKRLRPLLRDYLWISETESMMFPNAQGQSLFVRRVYKAVYKLYRHHLLNRVERGVYELTNWGDQLIEAYSEIREDMIDRFPVRVELDENPYISDDYWYPNEMPINRFGFNEGRFAVEPWYNLSEEEFEGLYQSDNRFRKIIDSGRFVLQDGQILPIRYRLNQGAYSDLCVELVLDSSYGIVVKKDFTSKRVFFDSITHNNRNVTYFEFLTLAKKPIDWEVANTEDVIEQILRELPDDIVEIFKYLKRKLGVNWEKLARVLGISDRILRYWKNPTEDGDTKVEIPLEKLIGICLALNLPTEVSELIIKRINPFDKNGDHYDPDAAGGDQRVWEHLMKRHFTKSTLEINELCKKNGIEPLFSENKEDHSDGPQGAGRIAGRNSTRNN